MVGAAAAAGLGVARLRGADPAQLPSTGPLACLPCIGEATSLTVEPGRPFTHGLVLLHNRGRRAATLLGVRIDVPDGVSVVGARLLDPARSPWGLTALDRRFPPGGLRSRARPLRGAVVPPSRTGGDGREVLVGLVVRRAGVFVFHRIAVDYAVGGTRYRAVFPESMRVCAPRGYAGRCEPPRFSR